MTPVVKPKLRGTRNLTPLPYRGVSVQPYAGEMTEAAIVAQLLGREAYRRTEFIVLRGPQAQYAVVAVTARDRAPLFSPIDSVEALALPDDCVYIKDPQTDCGNRSALAALARKYDVGPDRTLICEGKFDHVNFIHCPRPLIVKVVEVAPPEPPKLFDLVTHVLSYADLPPIVPLLERIDLKSLVLGARPPAFLAPCRSGGLDDLGAPSITSTSGRRRVRTGRSSAASEACSFIVTITATSRAASKCARASSPAVAASRRSSNAVCSNSTLNATAR